MRRVSPLDRVPVLPSRRRFGAQALAALGSALVIGPAGALGCHAHGPPLRVEPRGGGPGAKASELETLTTPEGEVTIDAIDPQLGPRDARALFVVFSDFQCPFCRDAALVLERLRKELPGKLRVVFKHLPSNRHRSAHAASIAAQIVFLEAGSDAFWRFHDRAFANQAEIDDDHLTEWAHSEGVGAEAIVQRAPEAERRVRDDMELAARLGIHGTPHLYLNDRVIDGFYPYEMMRSWVDDAL
jgi:protein-disulfide isomerase